MEDLRIVIPAYNEEDGIAETIERVKKTCPASEIIVVNDASQDATEEIAQKKGVEVITNKANRGKGGATKVGLNYNSGRNVKYLAFIDADCTYPPEALPELYKKCKNEGFDLAIGSRFLGPNKGMPPVRKLGNQLFASMLSWYASRLTTDTSTGLRVFGRQLLPLLESTPDGLDFDTCMTSKVLFQGYKYAEVPIEYSSRQGRSKLSAIKDGYRFLKVIMNETRKYRPKRFYLTLGIPFLILQKLVTTVKK
jgi:glycosyltransferase involved in cell wall biosynthesis